MYASAYESGDGREEGSRPEGNIDISVLASGGRRAAVKQGALEELRVEVVLR